MKINLNESGRPAGQFGDLRNVYVLGSYDPANEYTITVESLEAPETEGGSITVPVKSIGRIGGIEGKDWDAPGGVVQYFFATDLRFICYPGAVCMFPSSITLEVQQSTTFDGKHRARIVYDGWELKRTGDRTTEIEAIDELGAWSLGYKPGKWILPEVVSLAADRAREMEVAELD